MEYVVNKGEVVVLENGNAYKAINFIEKDGVGYICFYKFSDDIEVPLNFDPNNIVFATEVVEGDDYFIDEVVDTKLIDELKKLYINH